MQTRSRRQREILDFIIEFVESHGYEPSYQQIARHFGLSSKGGVARHIEALEQKGLLRRNRESGKFNLEIYPESFVNEHICEVAWLDGSAANGASEDSAPLFVPKSLLGFRTAKQMRGMIVPDNAMSGEHILEGDIALIESKSFARDGDCVAALVDKKRLTLGNYFRKGSAVEIRPSNESYEPVRAQADNIEILGLYRGLLRKA
ncbi:MAG TPA: S24 family peptidase [Aridibacter sp.]|nr:S24 family peptidase [Aridibacter sp.]